MPKPHDFDLKVSDDDEAVAYLKLPGFPSLIPGVVKRTVRVRDLVGDYKGPDLYLDFSKENVLIGIEIVG